MEEDIRSEAQARPGGYLYMKNRSSFLWGDWVLRGGENRYGQITNGIRG